MDDLTGEFPRIDDRFALQKHSHGYYAGNIGKHPKGMSLNTIVHYDFLKDKREHFTTQNGGAFGEPVFIPKSSNSKDGDGWLVATEYNSIENRSNLVILNALNVS